MSSIQELKRRINSIEKTQKITKAMKLVSTAKLKVIQKHAIKTNLFKDNFEQIFFRIINEYDNFKKFDKGFSSKKTYYIAITSDLGLCGSFNQVIIKQVLKEKTPDDYLFVLGAKGTQVLSKLSNTKSRINIHNKPILDDFNNIAKDVVSRFRTKEIFQIKIIYNKYINSVAQEMVSKTIFPIDKQEIAKHCHYRKNEFEIEPNPGRVFYELLPIYFLVKIFDALVQSKLSEFSLRRSSMENATDNAQSIIDDLKLKYNRARQSNITQEINEIIAGSE